MPLVYYLVGALAGLCLGWQVRTLWGEIAARRFLAAVLVHDAARRAREATARRERRVLWWIRAESDEEAWAAFHARARLGRTG